MRALPRLLLLLVAAATEAASAPADVENNLVFRRQSGETITFPATAKTFAWCGPYDPGSVAIPADVVIGQPQLFPNHWLWPNPDSVEIFVGDPPNEAATDTEDAAGSIVFQKLDCNEGGEVEFTIDARVGSEFGDGPTPPAIPAEERRPRSRDPAPRAFSPPRGIRDGGRADSRSSASAPPRKGRARRRRRPPAT